MRRYGRRFMCILVAVCIGMLPCYAYSKKEKRGEITIEAVDEDMQKYIVAGDDDEPMAWTNKDIKIRINASAKERIVKLEYSVGDGKPVVKEYCYEEEKIAEKITTEKQTTEKVTTEEKTTEVSTQEEITTEEATTQETTTEEGTSEEATTEENTTQEGREETTTEEATTQEESTTEETTTEEATTHEESTTEEATTEEATTQEESTTEEATTEEATTQEEKTTEEITTEETTTEEITTEEITTEKVTEEKKKELSRVSEEVLVSTTSTNRRGIPIKVIVTDIKGKTQTLLRWIHIDKNVPVIEYESIDNNTLYDSDVNVVVGVSELNYQPDKVEAFGVRTDIDGKEHLVSFSEIERTENGGKLSLVLTTDGIYKLHMGVTDAAGNTADKELHFLIDKTAPTLPDISAISGKTYESFRFADYGRPVFKDLTLVESKMILNGCEYDGKTRITESGRYNLYVEAMDELGHKSSGAASFVVANDEKSDVKEDNTQDRTTENTMLDETPSDEKNYTEKNTTEQKDAHDEEMVYNDEEKNPSMKKEILLWLGLSCLIWMVLFLIRKNSTANIGK
ncbi:MAG: hypothetical protein K6G76_04420 [Lachnospiraceae bacterium]|nr:hypothetical protein [Lachnospiraceae bacterium]